jgi:hypothetical protein
LQQALSLDDWRPLIAASLITLAWGRARGRRILKIWAISTLAVYGALAVAIIFFPTSNQILQGIEAFVGFLGWFLGLVVVGLINSPKRRREMFSADKQVAGIVGKGKFLETLGKLENLGMDSSSTTRRGERYRAPTIKERIASLQSSTS